ncbi:MULTISPECIES: NADH-quinone oxidoreductase subunit NuoN [unclassified Massilia]|uniref:NADH-quinone oxidoreductase subunit NuoN n=1 Tax=unclassified Massilia TaxID=2609279 RepID=UPI00177AA672|nr:MULTISPECIES: NADH-quinone oxidoreductase subunit NuoN [unclassified Massilia]MBD8532477.1 NADH-quinone oxidoreductase subunit NuoN [Massilia sp. CFBP 13647]MBD8675847.1 NADH-quinone oxidoreductase subunit NuoN [Massilia sp. CFBP 13721]
MNNTLLAAVDTNLVPVYAEIFLLIAASAILLIDMYLKGTRRNVTYYLSLLTLVGCAVITAADFNAGATVYTFNGMYVSDPMSNLLKLFTYLAVGLTLVYSRQYVTERGMLSGNLGGEFYVLALFTMLGQMIMISGNSTLSIYLGLELMSLSLYALVALRRDHATSTEAAMKYFILGSLASGFMLYGISMIYGATGSLNLPDIARVAATGANQTILVFGLVFLVAGMAFKLGAVPFHMWAPDVYQGSPTAVTLLLGGAPKLASFAMVMRLLVEALPTLAFDWQQMLLVLAVLSLAIGNLTAIAQTNLKRMLAYSTIAQMGFVLLGMMAGVVGGDASNMPAAYSAAMYSSITYVLTTLGSFGIIMMLARSGFEAEQIADFKGLGRRSPWFAVVMTVLMFSLAGVPPMMGFMAKWAVLQAVANTGAVWLAVVAVMFSLIGAFYYLRVVKTMWFDDAVDTSPIVTPTDMRVALSLNGVAVVVLGLIPGALLGACLQAIQLTLKS